MQVNEVISALHPLLNEKWITPLMNTQWFLAQINNAVQFIYSYKWRIRTWQLKYIEVDTTNNNTGDIITVNTDKIINSVHWLIYTKWNTSTKKDISLVYSPAFLNIVETHKVPLYTNREWRQISFMLTDWNVDKVWVIYFKWHEKLLSVDDEINLPYVFLPAVISFSAAYILPIYNQDQWITNWHYQQWINIMESIRLLDNNTSWTLSFKS